VLGRGSSVVVGDLVGVEVVVVVVVGLGRVVTCRGWC